MFDRIGRLPTTHSGRRLFADELADLMPGYSWAQIFSAVDRLTREGTVTLKHPAPFCYLLSLPPREPAEARHVMQS